MMHLVNGNVEFIDPSIPATSTGRVIAHVPRGEFAMARKEVGKKAHPLVSFHCETRNRVH